MALAASTPASSNLHSTSNTTTYTTASFTPVSNSLMVIWTCTRGAATHTHAMTGSTTGTIDKKIAEFGTAAAMTASLWVVKIPAGAAATTLTNTSTSATGCHIQVVCWTDYDATLTALAALIQANTQTVASNTSGSQTLPNANGAKAANRVGSFWCHSAQEAANPRASWTELDDGNFATPASGSESQVRTDAYEQTYSASWTTSSNALAAGYEVQQAGSLPLRRSRPPASMRTVAA